MKPLEKFRSHMTVVSQLCDPLDGHATTVAAWLSGAIPKRTLAENVHAGVTVDQVIADQIGQDTPMRSLELATEDFTGWIGGCDPSYSCAYMNTISWKNATTPMPMEINPRSVFERMFGRPGTAAQRKARMATDRSVLDSLLEELGGLKRGLGGKDANRLNDYLENVREIEQRIQKAEQQSAGNVEVPDAPVGIPEEFEDHAALMYDLMALAYEADLTRVVTYMKSRDASQRVYPKIGVTEPHHAMSHHGNNPEKLANLVKVNTHHVALFAKFVEKLAVDARRRRLAARPHRDPLRQRHERERYPQPHQHPDAAGGEGRRAAEGQPPRGGAEGNADGELPARPGQQVRVDGDDASASARRASRCSPGGPGENGDAEALPACWRSCSRWRRPPRRRRRSSTR